MENKTAEEILRENGVTVDGENITQGYYNAVVYVMKLFTDQQVDKAIDKALQMASSEVEFIVCATTYERIGRYLILSLKPEILKELEK